MYIYSKYIIPPGIDYNPRYVCRIQKKWKCSSNNNIYIYIYIRTVSTTTLLL